MVLLDWDLATAGTPAVEFAWYLCHDAWRIDATKDEIVEDFLAAEDGPSAGRRSTSGSSPGSSSTAGSSATARVVHPDPAERAWAREELGWWVPRVRAALERAGPSARA